MFVSIYYGFSLKRIYGFSLKRIYGFILPFRPSILRERAATLLYLLPFELCCRARTNAAYNPLVLILHVFLLHTGNDLLLPKKHFFPHFLSIVVFWRAFGFCDFQPAQGTFLRVFVITI